MQSLTVEDGWGFGMGHRYGHKKSQGMIYVLITDHMLLKNWFVGVMRRSSSSNREQKSFRTR